MADKKLCFIVSPIGKPDSEVRIHADWVLDGVIRPVMNKFPDFIVKRADDDSRPGLIDIHLQLASENVPFDVSLYRAIKFSLAKHRDVEAAKSELEKAVQAVLVMGY